MDKEAFRSEMDALYKEYEPIYEKAREKDMERYIRGATKDGGEEYSKIFKEFNQKYNAIRRKYGIIP